MDFLDLFDAARVPFYDGSFSCHSRSGTNLPSIFAIGCMVVELLDYRSFNLNEPPPEKPTRTRVILHPNSESLWADICSLNQKYGSKWTDEEAVEIEAKLLVSYLPLRLTCRFIKYQLATSPPLCLDPDPHLTRIANNVLRVSTPTVPVSLKRKASAMDTEENDANRARRAKIMTFMTPRTNRAQPRYISVIKDMPGFPDSCL